MEDIRPGRVPLPPDKRYQERGSSCLPVFGAVLWALAGVTRRPYKFERPLTIEVLSSTRFLEVVGRHIGDYQPNDGIRCYDRF